MQAPIQLEILREITNLARNGDMLKHIESIETSGNDKISSAYQVTTHGFTTSFNKIIHVGHSFGSILTTAFLSTYGNASDAAVLTGFIQNEHFAELRKTGAGLELASQNDPTLFGDRSSGYMVDGTPSSFQSMFFSTHTNEITGIGGFDPEVLDYAFSTRRTITASEFLTPTVNLGPATAFEGPLQFVLAEFDFPVCRGDCRLDFGGVREMYPNAKDVDIYTQPGNGHALTMHRGAKLGYKATLDWLDKNEL